MAFNSFSLDVDLAKDQAQSTLSNQNISEQNLRAGCKVVQDKAISHLQQFKTIIKELDANYRKEFLPPPSREQPFPNKNAIAFAKSLTDLKTKLEQKEVMVRNSINPNDDNIARKYRNNKETLLTLALLDEQFLSYVQQFNQFFSGLDFNLNSFVMGSDSQSVNYIQEVNQKIYQNSLIHLEQFLNDVANLIKQRQDFLAL